LNKQKDYNENEKSEELENISQDKIAIQIRGVNLALKKQKPDCCVYDNIIEVA